MNLKVFSREWWPSHPQKRGVWRVEVKEAEVVSVINASKRKRNFFHSWKNILNFNQKKKEASLFRKISFLKFFFCWKCWVFFKCRFIGFDDKMLEFSDKKNDVSSSSFYPLCQFEFNAFRIYGHVKR
jgi:hypothetical protein